MKERTVLLLKPDGVELGLEGVVREDLSRVGLRVVRRSSMRLDKSVVAEHYAHHSDKPFFPWLLTYMTRGPVIGLIVEGEDAIGKVRLLVGATDPRKAAPDTLRARFGRIRPDGYVENVIHASEKAEEAEAEIRRFFGDIRPWWARLFRWCAPRASA